jgi:TonB family protein
VRRSLFIPFLLCFFASGIQAQGAPNSNDASGDGEQKESPSGSDGADLPTDTPTEAQNVPPKLTKAPELLKSVDPIYPPEAVQERIEGDVVLKISIGADGKVMSAEVHQGVHPLLDAAAVAAAEQFEFSPAEWDGKPGPVAILFKQVFRLDKTELPPEAKSEEELKAEEEAQKAEEEAKAAPILSMKGVVRESGSKAPVEGVEISLLAKNADGSLNEEVDPASLPLGYTDENGYFELFDVPPGDYRITYAAPSFETAFTDDSVEEGLVTQMVIYIRPSSTNLFEVVVRKRRAEKEVAKIALSREEVEKIPGTFGDPIRVIENLPGLARAPFIGGALIVRGANPADSGVYFDGVPIPILYHFGGLKSVVNSQFLEEINFYPGGFGARYGRATAGIVDVTSRDLKEERFVGFTDLSLIDSGFFVGGPLKPFDFFPTINFAAAARRSYIDAILPIILDSLVGPDAIFLSPVYWDLQFKADIRPWDGHQFSLFTFGSSDDLALIGEGDGVTAQLGFLQTFQRLVGQWKITMGKDFTHVTQPFVGLDQTQIGLTANELEADITNDIVAWGVRDEIRWNPGDRVAAVVGADYLGQTNGFELSFPTPSPQEFGGFPRIYNRFPDTEETIDISQAGDIQSVGFFAESSLSLIPNLKLTTGIRGDLYNFRYWTDEDTTDDEEVEYDPFGTPTSEIQQWTADPRAAIRYDVLKGTTLKGAVGIYHQPPAFNQINPNIGNPNLEQPRAIQYIAGVEQAVAPRVNVDLQVYYTSRDLLVQSTDEEILEDDGTVTPVNFNNGGVGNTLGLEVLLRHELENYPLVGIGDWFRESFPGIYSPWMDGFFTQVGFFGWIAYTLSRTEIDLDEDTEQRVLSNFDQTHILTIIAQANLPFDLSFGGRFRLVSGNPTNAPLGSVHDLDRNNYIAVAPTGDQTRLPTFHQLDLRLDRRFVFDQLTLTPYLDLINVYNQANAETYQTDYRSIDQEPINGLPFFPNFGIQGEF